MITVIKLKSDNFDCLVTKEVYAQIRLEMSSGDFGAHQAYEVEVEDFSEVCTELEYYE